MLGPTQPVIHTSSQAMTLDRHGDLPAVFRPLYRKNRTLVSGQHGVVFVGLGVPQDCGTMPQKEQAGHLVLKYRVVCFLPCAFVYPMAHAALPKQFP